MTARTNNEAILVTGSKGFIGRSLCRRLTNLNYSLFELNSENDGVCLEDNLTVFADQGIRHVFHLAGKTFIPESWDKPSLYFNVNTVGTQNVLEFCRKSGSSLTFISSYLYGVPDRLPIDETAPLQRHSPYANSKFLAEELCRFYANEFGVPCTILRPFNVFGPGQSKDMLIPQIVEQVLAGCEIRVKDLTPRRDYLYVEDLVDVILLSYPANKDLAIYNVGSGVSYSVRDIVDMVQRIAGTSLAVHSSNEFRRNEIPDVRADSSLLQRIFGWHPKTGMEDGLRLTIEDSRKRQQLTPINKGNYSMEPREREERFERIRGEGWQDEYRQYRQEWTALPRLQKVRDYPLQVDLELSSMCNIACPMCFTRTDAFRKSVSCCYMDDQLFRRVIDEIAGHVPAVRLSLRGEATLHPHFIDHISYAKMRGIPEVSFLTNGSTMTPEFFEEVMLAGADWITFSIDGLGDTYEKIRQPLKFNKILDTIRTVHRIKQAHDCLRPVVKVQTLWPAIKNNPEAFYDTFAPDSDLVAFNPLIDYLGKDDDIVFEEEFVCPQLYQRVLIGADGKVLLCSNDEMCSISPGDANQQKIYDIWHGEVLQRIRNIHLQPHGFMEVPVCRHCYLPRRTEDSEKAVIHGREFHIPNYVNRSQEIGT
jgi:nucleoside-diphosphate-sugar epimerase/sulfatase maturation enzyme AslB (radical SAM superfamily)